MQHCFASVTEPIRHPEVRAKRASKDERPILRVGPFEARASRQPRRPGTRGAAMHAGKARTVPLHEDLVEQGFLAFVKANGAGPLFYNASKQPGGPIDPTNPRKPRYVKAREQVATWVRSLGVNDPELSPNHAWRHTFKAIGFRSGMSEKVLDAIVGHAPASVGRGYGEPTLADKTKELQKFPRYKVRN